MSMKVNRIVQGWDESGAPNDRAGSRVAEVREADTSHFLISPVPGQGKTLLSSGKANLESCTATAGSLASCGAEEMLLHLGTAPPALADACPLPERWLRLPERAPAARDGHQAALSRVTAEGIPGWQKPAWFLLPWLVLLHTSAVAPPRMGSLRLCTSRRE